MNITIYYLTKKIILQQVNQHSENQSIINIDLFKKSEVLAKFELFINQTNLEELIIETVNLEKGLDKFRKCFKYIYAAGGLIEKDGAYLFIFRLKKWDLPKGKLDMGEGPEEAAIRECEEECGINALKIKHALPSTYHIYAHKNGYALKKTYWYKMSTTFEGSFKPQLEENIEKVEWFDKEQIQQHVLLNSYPAIQHIVETIILS
jgi:8-oxo-dGTP pyrophosphatase MutT (NUDIX family)